MIESLYTPFRHWSETGSVYILSDTHFDDPDCRLMDPEWISPQEQIDIIRKLVHKTDTFIHLGDVGNGEYLSQVKAKKKILLLGNHDRRSDYLDLFDEIYTGISDVQSSFPALSPAYTWTVCHASFSERGIFRISPASEDCSRLIPDAFSEST